MVVRTKCLPPENPGWYALGVIISVMSDPVQPLRSRPWRSPRRARCRWARARRRRLGARPAPRAWRHGRRRRVYASRPTGCEACPPRGRRPRRRGGRVVHGSTRWRASTWRFRPSRKWGAGTAVRRPAIPAWSVEDACRRRGLHDQRDPLDPLTNRVLRPVRRPADLDGRVLRMVDERTFPRYSLRVLRRPAVAARSRCTMDEDTKRVCPRGGPWTTCRANASSGVPRISCCWRTGRRSASRSLELGVIQALIPEMAALVNCRRSPSGTAKATCGCTRSWSSTRCDRASATSIALAASTLMLGAVCHDFGNAHDRVSPTPHPLARPRARGLPPTLAWLDRLNLHTIGRLRRPPPTWSAWSAYHLAPGMWHKSSSTVGDGRSGGFSRRSTSRCWRGSPRDCKGRAGKFDAPR